MTLTNHSAQSRQVVSLTQHEGIKALCVVAHRQCESLHVQKYSRSFKFALSKETHRFREGLFDAERTMGLSYR